MNFREHFKDKSNVVDKENKMLKKLNGIKSKVHHIMLCQILFERPLKEKMYQEVSLNIRVQENDFKNCGNS